MTKSIASYSITSHGYMLPDYFQGHGTSFTKWDDCATGCGTSEREALDDAIDSLAQNDWDVSLLKPELGKASVELIPDDCEESYYYVSVDVQGNHPQHD